MELWTEQEFERVALKTRLSQRTLAACRDVLIEGMQGIDAAEKHRMFPEQISRSLGTLRDKKEQFLESAAQLQAGNAIFKLTAEQVAKNIVGPDLVVKDAVAGQAYEGKVVVNTHGFVVQKLARQAVMHEEAKLDGPAPIGERLRISYPGSGGKATVETLSPEKSKGADLGL